MSLLNYKTIMSTKKRKSKTILFRLDNKKLFTTIFRHLEEIVSDVILNFDENGMNFQGLGSSQITMSFLKWDKSDFDEYNIPSSKTSIGISIRNLNILLKMQKEGTLQFALYNNSTDYLNITMTNKVDSDYGVDVDMALMDLDVEELTVPEVQYAVETIFDVNNLQNIISNINQVADNIVIKIHENNFVFYAKGDSSKVECELEYKTQPIELKHNSEDDIRVKFVISYLNTFCRFKECSDNVHVNIDNEYPINMLFKFNSSSTLNLYLASKMDDEEL